MPRYRIGSIATLAASFDGGPETRSQLSRLEDYAGRLDVDAEYELAEVAKVVGKTLSTPLPTEAGVSRVRGREVVGDLRRLVEDLSEAVGLDSGSLDEPFLTVDQAGEHFDVPAEVIDRWRDRGLISRRVRVGARTRIGFTRSSLTNFAANHADEIEKSKDDVPPRRATATRPEAAGEASPPAAPDVPASKPSGRARGAVSDAEAREIVRHHRRGTPITQIAKRTGRSRSTVRRVLTTTRTERLAEVDLAFIDSDEFHAADAEARIVGAEPPESAGRVSRPPSGLPAYLASLYTVPLLNREQEQYWFRRMNYLKFKATGLRDAVVAKKGPTDREFAAVERLVREIDEIKDFLIRSNLRLVVSLAKKKVATGRDFFEMVSDGNVSLIRAVEKFDYAKGNKFSTYATWAIVKNYARSIPAEHKQLERFRTGVDEALDASGADAAVPLRAEIENKAQKQVLKRYLSRLEDRERSIMVARFGLEPGTEPMTLEQVGRTLGVTKERVRQLQGRALRKLRGIADAEPLDVPGI